jgi:hypothetical protein
MSLFEDPSKKMYIFFIVESGQWKHGLNVIAISFCIQLVAFDQVEHQLWV